MRISVVRFFFLFKTDHASPVSTAVRRNNILTRQLQGAYYVRAARRGPSAVSRTLAFTFCRDVRVIFFCARDMYLHHDESENRIVTQSTPRQ